MLLKVRISVNTHRGVPGQPAPWVLRLLFGIPLGLGAGAHGDSEFWLILGILFLANRVRVNEPLQIDIW